MKLLVGSDLAGFVKERQAKQVRALRQAHGILPRLAIVTDTDDPVTAVYLGLKRRYGEDILVDVELCHAEPATIVETITSLNNRKDIQGIIVQLPLADMSQTDRVLAAVDKNKDIDGLCPDPILDAATPTAIHWLLAGHGIELAGKKIAIVGRGRLVGAPLERIWRASGLDVTVFEEGDNLEKLSNYEVVVTAAGVPGLVTADMVAQGAVIVDAGTAVEAGEIRGDVSDEVRQRIDVTITPEKGGVGPLTVTALFDNLITACLKLAQQLP